MLLDLTVSQLALVEHLALNFHAGMTVITGETGAGKSILLTALNLILGGKADPILIRNGADNAEVHATFDLSGLPGALLWLAEVDLTHDVATHECLIRRILYANGRSKAYINGHPVTQTQLKVLGEYLVQMHGQHKHQMLLKPYEQLRLLDACGKHDGLLTRCQVLSQRFDKLVKQKKQLIADQTGLNDQLALLRYQVEELDQLGLTQDEFSELSQAHSNLAHAEENAGVVHTALSQLEADADNLMHAAKQLEKLTTLRKQLDNTLTLLQSANIHLTEATQELNRLNEGIELNPEKLTQIEARLETLHNVARKHRIKPEALYQHAEDLKAKLDTLENSAQRLTVIDEEIAMLNKEYLSAADALSQSRKAAANKLSEAISNSIAELGMQEAVFSVQFSTPTPPFEPHAYGYDQICFCVSANPGHPPQPLHKVASGGELSRISLAIQLITAEAEHTPTLIFDEADVGVGGQTAIKVGQTLRALGNKAQVLCVTHLPQVAAFGQQHLLVKKESDQRTTQSRITELNKAARLKEIARMLSGDSESKQALQHAKTLLVE